MSFNFNNFLQHFLWVCGYLILSFSHSLLLFRFHFSKNLLLIAIGRPRKQANAAIPHPFSIPSRWPNSIVPKQLLKVKVGLARKAQSVELKLMEKSWGGIKMIEIEGHSVNEIHYNERGDVSWRFGWIVRSSFDL